MSTATFAEPATRPDTHPTDPTDQAVDAAVPLGRLVRKITPYEGNKVPAETREEIYYLYWVVGLSLVEVSKRVFWSEKTCGAVLIADGHGIREYTTRCVFTAEERKTITRMFEQGAPNQAIADRVGCYRGTVTDWLKVWGYDVDARAKWGRARHRRIAATTDPDATRIREEIERHPGITPSRIARQTGLSAPNVRNRVRTLREAGIVRPVGGARGSQGRPYVRTRRSLDDPLMPPMPPAKVVDMHPSGQVKKEERLPVEPLRVWVEQLVAEERERLRRLPPNPLNIGANDEPSGMTVLAHRLMTNAKDPERRLRALLYEQKNVSIDVADQMLLNSGRVVSLSDIWPERFSS
jgi:ribosomal protein S25